MCADRSENSRVKRVAPVVGAGGGRPGAAVESDFDFCHGDVIRRGPEMTTLPETIAPFVGERIVTDGRAGSLNVVEAGGDCR